MTTFRVGELDLRAPRHWTSSAAISKGCRAAVAGSASEVAAAVPRTCLGGLVTFIALARRRLRRRAGSVTRPSALQCATEFQWWRWAVSFASSYG